MHETEARAPLLRSSAGHSPRSGGSPRTWWVSANADDATQETYLAAWRSLPSFRGESSARTWLLVIARRTALRLGRRQRRLSELDRESPGPLTAPDPAGWTELDSLINQLHEDRRVALVLTQVLGLSYADAAQVCGCALGTIRSRVARAREDLLALRSLGDRRPRAWALGESSPESSTPRLHTGG